MSNEQFEQAAIDIEYPGAWDELEAVTALLQTNARATLALAYEQRTANLIAIWQTGEIRSGDETFGIMAEYRMSLYKEIAERLGFKE